MSDGDAADLTELEPTRRKGSLKTRSLVLGAVLVVAAGAALFTWRQVKPVVESRKYASVTYEVPKAPKLTPAEGETVYRIDPTKSSLTYAVKENFAGKETSTAKGTTNGIAGDIAIDPSDLAATRVGPMVVNLEQLHSDNNLRDARLRLDYLESHEFPLATFKATEISGLEGKLAEGKAQDFTMTGDLTVKEITKPATFTGTASLEDGALTVKATSKAKLSDFDAGPIRIAGMVSTSDDAALTLKLTAYDPTERTIPTRISGPDAKEPTGGPSFAKTVQPILEANCVSCHNTGQMGAHAVTIDTAGDARSVSDGLKTVTTLKHMPPWPASDEGVPLKHKMTLTQDEIDAIAAWSDAGAPLDVSPEALVKPKPTDPGPQPRKDIVLDRPAYTGSMDNTNDYRCFVLDPKLTEPTYLTGYTFLADQIEELHHAQVFHISAEQVESSKAVDGKDGQPGWGCYSGPNLRGQRPSKVPGRAPKRDVGFSGQANLVAGWVPGQGPSDFGKDTGILMEPGDALVLQLHYHYGSEPTPDESTLALQVEPGTKDLKALRVINPIGPVEIPCAPEDQDAPLCDRDAALADNVKLYGPSGAANEAGLLMLCNKTPEELTKDFDGQVASSSCDQTVPEDGTIVGVLGHMHTLGKSFRLTLDADTDDEQILLDIPEWSFDWQMNYELETPIHVKAGQPLRMECSWDRGADPLRPPKYIVFAEGTEDEMCFATYALIPDDQG
ncbi:MAG TPA: YceI family protein [Acidimicrobiales bacterium]|nr:YceI family protein [Acidimicrobiales bacterium]